MPSPLNWVEAKILTVSAVSFGVMAVASGLAEVEEDLFGGGVEVFAFGGGIADGGEGEG